MSSADSASTSTRSLPIAAAPGSDNARNTIASVLSASAETIDRDSNIAISSTIELGGCSKPTLSGPDSLCTPLIVSCGTADSQANQGARLQVKYIRFKRCLSG